jgi:hypothetical protein
MVLSPENFFSGKRRTGKIKKSKLNYQNLSARQPFDEPGKIFSSHRADSQKIIELSTKTYLVATYQEYKNIVYLLF